ncbi:MAG: radical SAM protein [Eubacterium sp.]|nr:radical SAM protein [Eubacterium sp.]
MIIKTRREKFGGIVFFEKPGFVGYVNNAMADSIGIKKNDKAHYINNVFASPLDAHFAVTTRCNMYCKGCYNTVKSDGNIDIDFDKAKRIIDNLSALSVLSISFGGGEPTLYPHIIELAEYARSKSILPNITTNGLTMNESFAKRCKVFGNVHFSIHKPADIEIAFNAAKTYRKQTGKRAGLNLLITTETYPLLEEIIRKANKSAFNKILFLRYKRTDKNTEIDDLPMDDMMPLVFEKLKSLQRKSRLKFLYDCSSMQEIAYSKLISKKLMNKVDANGCFGGNMYIAIDVNGNYKPCSFWNETVGDAEFLNFDNWITNEKLTEFRNYKASAHCSACDYAELCNGGCRLKYLNCKKTDFIV